MKLDCLIPVSAHMQVRDLALLFHYCYYFVHVICFIYLMLVVMQNMKKWRCYP